MPTFSLTAIVCALVAAVIGVQTLRLAVAQHEIAGMKAQEKAAQVAYQAQVAQASAISSQASTAFSAATAAIPAAFAPLKARIATDVTPKADASCGVLPDSFVSLWNAASAQASAVSGGPS